MRQSKNEMIELGFHLHVETEKAWLVSDTGDKEDGQWLPKSQCIARVTTRKTITLEVPEWLLDQKELEGI